MWLLFGVLFLLISFMHGLQTNCPSVLFFKIEQYLIMNFCNCSSLRHLTDLQKSLLLYWRQQEQTKSNPVSVANVCNLSNFPIFKTIFSANVIMVGNLTMRSGWILMRETRDLSEIRERTSRSSANFIMEVIVSFLRMLGCDRNPRPTRTLTCGIKRLPISLSLKMSLKSWFKNAK